MVYDTLLRNRDATKKIIRYDGGQEVKMQIREQVHRLKASKGGTIMTQREEGVSIP
jgi:CHASE3 domain sensor protein